MFQELYMWYMIHASEAGAEPTDPAAPKKTPTDPPGRVAALKYYIKCTISNFGCAEVGELQKREPKPLNMNDREQN